MNNEVITLRDRHTISKLNFSTPVQTIFHHEYDDPNDLCGGIAYGTEVICMCCGSVMPLDEIDFLQYDPEVWCNESDKVRNDLQYEFEAEQERV